MEVQFSFVGINLINNNDKIECDCKIGLINHVFTYVEKKMHIISCTNTTVIKKFFDTYCLRNRNVGELFQIYEGV